jgi:hypothetical protein
MPSNSAVSLLTPFASALQSKLRNKRKPLMPVVRIDLPTDKRNYYVPRNESALRQQQLFGAS